MATWQVSALHAYTAYTEIDSQNLKHVDVAQHYRRGLSDFSNLVDVSEPPFLQSYSNFNGLTLNWCPLTFLDLILIGHILRRYLFRL